MLDQQVPWAVGRRALVRIVEDAAGTILTGPWWEAVGRVVMKVETWQPPNRPVAAARGAVVETTYLRDQCPRCFEVSAHAPGCMVAANLARGVSEFWAPVVMPIAPPVGTGFALYLLRTDGALVWLDRADSANAWVLRARMAGLLMRSGEESPNALHVGFVALGPNGPTLEPWGSP